MLYIISPYRNRKDNLKIMANELKNFLNKLQINYIHIIVKQSNDLIFNRGKLRNIGFDYIMNNYEIKPSDYFCFHDIDIVPVDQNLYYYHPGNNVVHYYGHTFCLGCFFFINHDNYVKTNGFPNNYWGYGMEDCTLQLRCQKNNIKINRTGFIKRYKTDRIIELGHNRPSDDTVCDKLNKEKWREEILNPNRYLSNGLTTLDYKIKKIKNMDDNILKIHVNFEYNEHH